MSNVKHRTNQTIRDPLAPADTDERAAMVAAIGDAEDALAQAEADAQRDRDAHLAALLEAGDASAVISHTQRLHAAPVLVLQRQLALVRARLALLDWDATHYSQLHADALAALRKAEADAADADRALQGARAHIARVKTRVSGQADNRRVLGAEAERLTGTIVGKVDLASGSALRPRP